MINKLPESLKKINMKNIVFVASLLFVSFFVYKFFTMKKKEEFTIEDMLIPPLAQTGSAEYGYVCPVNGYRCKPRLVYKIDLEGQGDFAYQKYQKYKIVDEENIVRYSGLYQAAALPVGSYIIFDNGQEYLLTTLDTGIDPPDCPPVRRGLKE